MLIQWNQVERMLRRVRISGRYLAGFGALMGGLMLLAQTTAPPPAPPEQPLPFSHKAHAGDLKLACKMCHPNPDPGEAMEVVRPTVCMQCHSAIKTESPAIQKLAEAAKENRQIHWARVYAIPHYVAFNHRYHGEGGAKCEDCHGKVAEREALYREGDISMGGCMNCHRVRMISNRCNYCHDQR
ncbi:MAG: cytochrome c3 family protein [Candidatus Solibacter sp.]